MREVQFKNKDAKHRLNLNGKSIRFVDGRAEVSEAEAEAIEAMDDKDYKVMPLSPVGVMAEDKPKPKKGKGKKKSKK